MISYMRWLWRWESSGAGTGYSNHHLVTVRHHQWCRLQTYMYVCTHTHSLSRTLSVALTSKAFLIEQKWILLHQLTPLLQYCLFCSSQLMQILEQQFNKVRTHQSDDDCDRSLAPVRGRLWLVTRTSRDSWGTTLMNSCVLPIYHFLFSLFITVVYYFNYYYL